MMTEPSKTILSREQIRKALGVLREEQQAHPISSAQRRIFFLFGISIWTFVVSFCALVLFLDAERFGWLLDCSVALVVISFLSIVLLFFLNIKLVWQTLREFRLAFRTELWQLVARARTGPLWPRRLIIGFGVLFLAAFLTIFCCAAPFWGIPLTVALAAFFFLRFARKRLDVFRNADQLVTFLTKLDAGEGPAGIDQVAIPRDVFKEMAAIEDAHIQRRLGKAIDEFRDSGHGYAVLKSRAIIADIAKLDEANQLRVEARIAKLASESPPPDELRESGGVWRVSVRDTPYEIVCRQDEASRRIELLSLGQDDGKSSTLQTEEAPHA